MKTGTFTTISGIAGLKRDGEKCRAEQEPLKIFSSVLPCISGVLVMQHSNQTALRVSHGVQQARMPYVELDNFCPFIPIQLLYLTRIIYKHAPVLQGPRVPGSLVAS